MPRLFRGKPKPPASDASRERSAAEPDFDWRSYDAVAEEYERVHAPYNAVLARDLLDLAETGEGSRVLDVGTGTGHGVEVAVGLVGASGVAAGIDPAFRMLAVAKAARPDVSVVAADVLDLPFDDATFDVAVCNLSLSYFTKLDTALFDILRVVRAGGTLVASAWTGVEDEFSRSWRGLVEETAGREVIRGAMKDEAPWAEMLADKAKLEVVLRDAGLRPVTVHRRSYRFSIPREDYIVGLETEATGRFIRGMLGPRLWQGFRERVRDAFAERFPEQMTDFRDALLAVGTKPR